MDKELNYEEMANICLKADGGYCQGCADYVADGFKEVIPEIDIEKLKKIIDDKCREYYDK